MSFSVTILGSGAALPTSHRFPSAHALRVEDDMFLIDCAEGTQVQLRRFKIKIQQIRSIFISHMHGDHVFGLPGLLSSLSLLERTEPLNLYGPPLLEDWLVAQWKYFTPLGFPLHFHAAPAKEPAMIYEDRHLTVTSFPLKHRIPAWGYLFREKERPLNICREAIDFYHIPLRDIPSIKAGADYRTDEGSLVPNRRLTCPAPAPRSYAYCSDTVYLENLPAVVQGVNLLYHEATYARDGMARAKETFHSTAEDAAKIAKAAGADKLVIGHFSSRYRDIDILLQEARNIFENTEAAEDGKIFEIKRNRRAEQ